jgi:transposase InsO family protein
MSAAPQYDYLVDVARAAAEAGHGKKGAIYASAVQHLGISKSELHTRLNEVTVRKQRKQRSDAGSTAVTYDEAFMISCYLNEHIRRNGKRIKSTEQAVDELRANDKISAARVDKKTGELKPLSTSAILRALSHYKLHPGQIAEPDPVQALSSPHPNWCWQIDASLCVIFKMPVRGRRIEELRGQDAYKNKLQHLAKIEHLLVQRYLITDHASGAMSVYFALGGESVEGLVNTLIHTFIERPGFPLYGAPNILMLDQASANRSAMVRNLCRSLGIELSYTMPGNPRSKGQVEGAHNLFETGFESGLRLAPEISTTDQLQALADKWIHWFNGARPHSRHGMTRYEAWQLITGTQLRRVDGDAKMLRLLARSEPKTPKVTPYLTVDFLGDEYDVSQVPDVIVGQKLPVCRCGFDAEQAIVVRVDAAGHETFHLIPQKKREGDFSFYAGAAVIGREFKRFEDTPVQTAKKQMQMAATGTDTLKDAAKVRKTSAAPFNGEINPLKTAEEYRHPAWLPKRGEVIDTPKPILAPQRLSQFDFIDRLAGHMGKRWNPEFTPRIRAMYPDGGLVDDIPALAERLTGANPPAERPALRVVGA